MRVLMFGWEFPPYISGGLGTACFGLTQDLSKLGVDITFVLPKIKGELSNSFMRIIGPEQILDNCDINSIERSISHLNKYIEVDAVLHPYMNEESYAEFSQETTRQEKEIAKTKRSVSEMLNFTGDYGENLFSEVVRYSLVGKHLAEKEDFDIIHAHDWLTYLAGVEAKKVSGKKLIVHIHATEFDRCGDNINQQVYEIEKYGLQEADNIIAVSGRTKNMLVEKYDIDPAKIVVVHNAVTKNRLAPDIVRGEGPFATDKIVTFLGRITMQKGPEYFLEAAKLVIDKMPNVRFVMAGSGDLTRLMIERMASLQLAEKFHFTGFLSEARREELFAMSDLYVMPSVSEPFGLTPLEAMKYKIPIIISRQSGVAEILKHVIKVDFWDVKKMAAAIISVLTGEALSQCLVENGNEEFNNISWYKSASAVKEVYLNNLR